MQSYPGDDSAAKNHTVHSSCNRLLRGEQIPDDCLEKLAGALRYRLKTIMGRATEYKDRLGFQFPDCADCDLDYCRKEILKNKEKDAKYHKIWEIVVSCELFDEPGTGEGMFYIKGISHLVVIFTKSGWDPQRFEDELNQLVKL